MKYIKLFEEIINVSKVRKWPQLQSKSGSYTNTYFVYDLNKDERGKYLNVWFEGGKDEFITLKKCDEDTAGQLYHRDYNPVSVRIMKSYRGEGYDMKAQIHSVDDSSYGIWWNDMNYDELKTIQIQVMEMVNQFKSINGEMFLDECVDLGADPETKDYN